MTTDIINIIFGLKVRQARLDAGLTAAELAARCDLSPSYVTEIEKGRKYPKAEKILRMAEALGKGYDELVSIKLDPSLKYLEMVLSSPLIRRFPFDDFGLDASDLIDLLTRVPERVGALLHAVLEIGRQYDMKDEHFLRATLRSYQELRDNYFEELEEAAAQFARDNGLEGELPIGRDTLEGLLGGRYSYKLDEVHLARYPALAGYRSVFVNGTKPRLLINPSLAPSQVKFEVARQIGYQYLELKERAITSAPDRVDSFQQVFNDFKASYFAGALLMPQAAILADIQELFELPLWNADRLSAMLSRYDVTPEMLLYRFSELIPQFFGVRLHFLRFNDTASDYHLVKQLNMSRLLLPSGMALHEHFCRRWLVVRLLRELETERQNGPADIPLPGVQISEFLETRERFLCLGFARPLALAPHVNSSVIVGFRVEPNLKSTIRFVDDPAIPHVIISDTCERCPLTEEQCSLRAAEPVVLKAQRARQERQESLHQLLAGLQG